MTKRDFDRQARSRWPKYANDFAKRPHPNDAWVDLDCRRFGIPIEDDGELG